MKRILLTTVCGQDKTNYITDLRSKLPGAFILGIDMAIDKDHYVPRELDVAIKSPHGGSSEYESFIDEVIEKYNIDTVIPCSDPETVFFMDYYKNKRPGLKYVGTHSLCDLSSIYNKPICNQVLKDSALQELRIPHTEVLYSFNQIDTMVEQFGTVVIKPARGYGSRGLMVVSKDVNDFEQIMMKGGSHWKSVDMAKNILEIGIKTGTSNLGDFLIQEYWSGESLNVECVVVNGEVHAIVPHLRSGYRWGRLDQGELIWDPKILACANDIAIAFNIHSGVFNFEANYVTEGSRDKIGLVEINPRVSAVHAQCKFLGYDIIQAEIDQANEVIPHKFLELDIKQELAGGTPKYFITESEVGDRV